MNLTKIFPSRHDRGGTAELMTIAFPMIISTACDGVMTFTDRLFISRIGPEQMNAVMGGGVSTQLMTFFFIGLTGYTTALVAQYYGAGQKHLAGVVAFQAFIISFIAYPVILLCRPLIHMYFNLMDLPLVQLESQIEYFNIVIFGAISGILRNSLSCYFSGIGRTRIVMTANLAAMIINVVLDYVMIFGKLGLPAMGVKGAALATVTGSACGVLILIFAYIGKSNRREFHISETFRFDRNVMKKLLYFGYPAGIEFFLNFLAFNTLIFLFDSHGNVVATASTIMFNWDLVSFIPLIGIEIGVTSLVGRYMGAGDPKTAHRAAMSGIKTGLYYSVVILILFLAIPGALVSIFQPQFEVDIFSQAAPIAENMIRLASLYVLLEAVMVAIIGALRGAGDTHFTMLISVLAHWTMLPVVFVIMNVLNKSAIAGWLGLIIFFLVFCGVLILRYRSGKWQQIKVVERVSLP
ncbi:MAG TPA: MATE family efflux transporter [Bacteroidales bacterium]|jgi:MATE family multidrug resistance protein|nr:MATE family efflux transporter [Bacteroidales bacterium]